MTTVDAMKHLICYIKNDGTQISDITQTNAADLWEQIGIAFNARFNGENAGTGSSTNVLGTLSVTSLPGATIGTTTISVSSATSSESSFKYAIGNMEVPSYGADLSDWTDWDPASDVVANDGVRLVIAEVDSSNLAVAAGVVIVNANVS